jgi:hypothetical protein
MNFLTPPNNAANKIKIRSGLKDPALVPLVEVEVYVIPGLSAA